MKTTFIPLLLVLSMSPCVFGQTISAKTNKVSVDFSDPKSDTNSSFPSISWVTPVNETMFLKDNKVDIKFNVDSRHTIAKVTINVREKDAASLRGTSFVQLKENEKNNVTVEKRITLFEGVNEIEVIAENQQGIIVKSSRFVHVGETTLADASKLNRNDYALIIVTDNYDNWPKLVNPINDGRTIARELEKGFGFKTDVLENPSQEQIWAKMREYAEKKYQPLDQLFIFFAGHGHYDDTFKEGYVVTKESLPNDGGNQTYVSHNRLRSNINSIPCEHIMLVMDVCFGGTFDEAIASARNLEVYKEVSQSEFIIRKLAYKTRKYLTSGGKEYVSDGIAGKHSPFAKQIIEAFKTRGGNDGILSLSELLSNVERLNPEPKFGKFGSDAPGSEFIFVVKN